MTTSQNTWVAGSQAEAAVVTMPVPGSQVSLQLNQTAGPLLVAFAAAFHQTVQPLTPGDCWGWADRTIIGSDTVISNHASGTAIDLNATQHPLGSADLDTFTAAQIAQVHQLLANHHGLIRWGGDYHHRLDDMHFEINVPPDAFPTVASGPPFPGVLKPGASGDDVLTLQNRLVALGVHMKVTGEYDPVTVAAVTHFQLTHGLDQDGICDDTVWQALWPS